MAAEHARRSRRKISSFTWPGFVSGAWSTNACALRDDRMAPLHALFPKVHRRKRVRFLSPGELPQLVQAGPQHVGVSECRRRHVPGDTRPGIEAEEGFALKRQQPFPGDVVAPERDLIVGERVPIDLVEL